MDTEYRYKSFLAQDRCLTRENYGTLTIQPCTYAANQKWEWNKGFNRYWDLWIKEGGAPVDGNVLFEAVFGALHGF
jgi:hypothetical protein